MTDLKELEEAVANLSPDDYEEFRNWFEEFETKQWDNQFEDDVKAGRLDTVAKEAVRDYRNGTCTEL